MVPLNKAYRRLRQMWRSIDPWTIRPPDWAWEHEEIPHLPKSEKYFGMVYGGLPSLTLSSAIESTAGYIFPYGQRLDFDDRPKPSVADCDGIVNQVLSRGLLFPANDRSMYADAYDVIGLLRQATQAAFIFGETFYHVIWEKANTDHGEFWLVSRFNDLPSEPSRVDRRQGALVRSFDIDTWSLPEGSRKETLVLQEEDLLRLIWSYSPGVAPGRSPLDNIVKEVMQIAAFNRRTMAYTYALGAQDDHRIFVERSRSVRFKTEQDRLRCAEVGIRAKLGVQPDAPVSEYYGVYSYVNFLKMCNRARRELLNEFSRQVLYRAARKNGWDCEPRLEYQAGVPDEELDRLFAEYTSGNISERKFFDVIGPRSM